MKRILHAIVMISMLTLVTVYAQAQVIVSSKNNVFVSDSWTWTYQAQLSTSSELDSNGAVPNVLLTTTDMMPTGTYKDYFTIYDFDGFLPGSNFQPANFDFISQNVGPTPGRIAELTDDPNIPNLTWFYTGPTMTGPQILSFFGAKSSIGEMRRSIVAVDSTMHNKYTSPPDGYVSQSLRNIYVPGPADIILTPEPSTFLLLGAGVAGLAFWRRRKQ